MHSPRTDRPGGEQAILAPPGPLSGTVHALRARTLAKDDAAFTAYKAGVIDLGARPARPSPTK